MQYILKEEIKTVQKKIEEKNEVMYYWNDIRDYVALLLEIQRIATKRIQLSISEAHFYKMVSKYKQ